MAIDTSKPISQVTVDGVNVPIAHHLQSKIASASQSQQTIEPDEEFDGLSQVVIQPATLQNKTVTPTTDQQSVEKDSGYYGLGTVTVNAIETEQKTVKSTSTSQTITPTSGKFIDEVTVDPIVLQSKTITQNGTYDALDDSADGYSSVTVDVGEITIPLPEAYLNIPTIYVTQISNNKYFITGDTDASISTGLWLYNSSNNSLTSLESSFKKWDIYKEINGKILISNSGYNSNGGILLYDPITDNINKIYNYGRDWRNFAQVGQNWIICDNGGTSISRVLKYNPLDETITVVANTGYNVLHTVGTKCLMASKSYNSGNHVGIWVYNSADDSVTQVYTTGYKYGGFADNGTVCLIGTNTDSGGILKYNSADDSVTQVYASGGHWKHLYYVGNNKFLVNRSTSYQGDGYNGIWLYNLTDDTMTRILSNPACYGLSYFIELSNGQKVLSSYYPASSNYGVFIYDPTNDTVTRKYSSGLRYSVAEADGNNYYISSVESGYKKTLYYNTAAGTITYYSSEYTLD